MAFIEIKNINKQFGNNKVLNNVSLDIKKGSIVSIIGDSGNGKTTFLRCLCGLYTPDSGTITIDNEIIFPTPKNYDYFQNIGLVFQNYNLFNQYNALDNIKLSLDLDSKRKYKKEKLKQELENNEKIALDLLSKVNLMDKKDLYPYQLSGGQCQRVAIARALARKPKILCFDEPTSALDPKTRKTIEKIIKELKKEGQTMLIVSHDLEFVKNVSDEVYFMQEGIFVESGKTKDFFCNSKTNKLKEFLDSNKENEDDD